MKKLIGGSLLCLLMVLSVTVSPAVLLLQWATPQGMVLGLSGVDVSAITTYAEQKQANLISSLINGLDIAQDVMVMPGVKNKMVMPKLKVGDGARPYSGSQEFKAKDVIYTDRHLEVKVAKRDLQIDPEDYRSTYLAWLNSPGSGAGKKDIPFEQFLFSQILKAYQRELNDETSYYGFDGSATADFDAGTVYHAGDYVKFATATNNPNSVKDWYVCLATTTAAQSPDTTPAKWQYVTARAIAPGIKSYIDAGITASEISPVATGAITSSAGVAIAAFKKLYRAHGIPYQRNGIIISASYTDYQFLMDDLGDKYKALKADASENGYLVLPETDKKCIVKPATWLSTSRRLISGPVMPGSVMHQNIWMGTDLESDSNGISVKDTELWKLNIGVKSVLGFQIQDMNGIRVGDQS